MPTLAVTGAPGKTGQAIINACGHAWDIRALARNAQQAEALEVAGCEVVVGDMTEDSILGQLLEGAHSAYHICPNFHEGEVEIGAAVAAQAGGRASRLSLGVASPDTKNATSLEEATSRRTIARSNASQSHIYEVSTLYPKSEALYRVRVKGWGTRAAVFSARTNGNG